VIQEAIELGPIHPWLPGPMKVRLGMVGDQIASVETGFGFAARGIEGRVRGRSLEMATFHSGRIEPESAFILDRLFSEAVERILGIQAPARAVWIRDLCFELSELCAQLKFLARMASRMGLGVLYHAVLKQREALLDLVELLTGSRYGYHYIRAGGARYDLTDGFQERLDSWIGGFLADHDQTHELFRWTHPLQNRLKSMGLVVDPGDLGYVSEAAAESTRFGQVSHVESRLLYSLASCEEVCAALRTLLGSPVKGVFLERLPVDSRGGRWRSEVDTIRGPWSFDLELDQKHRVGALAVTTPSDRIRNAILPALEGESIEDLPLILESLSLSIPEIDR
jgi:Ni,Fe-hydrogenase III large subunit